MPFMRGEYVLLGRGGYVEVMLWPVFLSTSLWVKLSVAARTYIKAYVVVSKMLE